eukprot:9288266-Pyramimonas_sp.AAC.1
MTRIRRGGGGSENPAPSLLDASPGNMAGMGLNIEDRVAGGGGGGGGSASASARGGGAGRGRGGGRGRGRKEARWG